MEKKRKRNRRIRLFIVILLTLIIDFPILYLIISSFKSTSEIMMSETYLIPKNFTLENYDTLINRSNIMLNIRNSLFVAVTGTVASVVVASMAAFIMSRFRFRLVKIYGRFLLMIQMFPMILSLIPLFILFKNLNIINTHLSVIVVYLAMSLPFCCWMFKGFFDSIPFELEQAALIDGCSRTQSFFRIILPISSPGIISVSIYSFLLCWNEFMIANIFLRDAKLMTIPVGIQLFIQQYATDWGGMFAAATTAMIPAFIIFLFFQKYIVSGVAAGSVKG